MGTLDQVTQMRQNKMSDQEIISELRKQNISPREINEALNHAQIKNAVTDIQGEDETPMPQDQQQQYENYNQQQTPDQGYDQGQVYTPQPQQAYYPQQQQGYQDYGQQQQGYYPQPQATANTDTMVEISEQVFEEKISDIAKRVDSVDEFKILTQARMEHLNERLKRVESIIDRLQASILEKIGSYGSNLDSIKKEMSMMQDTFSKTMGSNSNVRTSRSVVEEEEATPDEEPEEQQQQAEKTSKKKK
jgi:hypothetical protein